MSDLERIMELEALKAELIMMQEFNADRRSQGYAPGYGAESFQEIADKIRELKKAK